MELKEENFNIDKIDVFYNGQNVGAISYTKNNCAAFRYTDKWLSNGFSISPFSLPLKNKVFISKFQPFEGLFGVFNDSLPDGWGRLLVDRKLSNLGINPNTVGFMPRLALLNNNSVGALEYYPSFKDHIKSDKIDLDRLAKECDILLSDAHQQDNKTLDTLFSMGGSSGGARPKCFYKIKGEDWIVKFKSSFDKKDIGLHEYKVALCAKKWGLAMSDVALMPSSTCKGYFATKRFDRISAAGKTNKLHFVSASGLLETSHRVPCLDYDSLIVLTLKLTKSKNEVLKMFKLMVFNILISNKDDHAKNFGFIYDDRGFWKTSPVYDLTTNNGFNGEHTTTINGKGIDISLKDILEVAKKAGIKESKAKNIVEDFTLILKEDDLLINYIQ